MTAVLDEAGYYMITYGELAHVWPYLHHHTSQLVAKNGRQGNAEVILCEVQVAVAQT
ncbi:hypothetical protein D3C73_1642580 [compost metagenome]